jgi:cytoskeletal protein CcmA (bactofilin family)
MWTKQSETQAPGASVPQRPIAPVTPLSAPAPIYPSGPVARDLAYLGSNLIIKGEISGNEDLRIDGKVEGSISLRGHKLTVGVTAQLSSQITAREVIVHGKVTGNLHATDRVTIKKDGQVNGDITTARIGIEDGAYFKGRIEIERTKATVQSDLESVAVPVGAATD